MNRLKLKFEIQSAQERSDFIQTYLTREEFRLKPPTKKELETISNYILWGKDANGEKIDVEIERKNQTWTEKKPESIEGLRAVEGFQESDLRPLGELPLPKLQKLKFDRNDAIGSPIEETFNNLFRRIDELDLLVTLYDCAQSKRSTPPRAELLNRFTEEELQRFQSIAAGLTEGRYLKLKHELVELRREQYTLRDSFRSTIFRHTNPIRPLPPQFPPLLVYPFGLYFDNPLSEKVFEEFPNPFNFSSEDLEELSTLIWGFEERKNELPSFLDPNFWNFLLDNYRILQDANDEALYNKQLHSEIPALKKTVDFYIDGAHLTPVQKEVLRLKINGVRNEDITRELFHKFKKSYSINYISTIYRKQIIDAICGFALNHWTTTKELFFSENFKVCKKCGRVLLKDTFNFTRKQRSSDGFMGSCKRCEKKKKENKKQ